MALSPGTRLGSHEILSPIGAGGMGEVYRARDTKLGRDVAVKVLPAEFSARSDALVRFEREARAVALLSHPNILAIHDFGSADGVSYAVMELLVGESMRQALADGPLPLRRTVDYAIQIARGLSAAHDKGIVHRDLKPGNIFITTDDRVKILDFGLARHDAALIADTASIAPTLPSPTEPGTVLGTVGYMAPEQVRGTAVDWRADIFSFGALLYEMVTGRRAFQRETAAETMTAILREDPPDLALDGSVPAAVDRIIRHCLEKKPDMRFRSAHDLAFALEAVVSPSRSGSASTQAEMNVRHRRAQWVMPLAIATLGTAAVLAAFWLGGRVDRATISDGTVQPPYFRQLTFDDATIWTARFAPDGRTVVYSSVHGGGDSRVLLTRLEFAGATPLSAPNAVLFAVSPNAEMLTGLNPLGPLREATLVRVPLLGGAARQLLEHVTFADWSAADGSIAVVHIVGSQQRLEFPVGNVVFQTEGEIAWPRVSPNGDRVAFLNWPVKDDDRGTVDIVDRAGQRQTVSRVWEAVRGLAWTPAGNEVWYSASEPGGQYELWGGGVGRAERRIYGAPVNVVLQDIAKDGKALIARHDHRIRVEGSLAGETGVRDLSQGDSWAFDISRDGGRVLLTYFGQGSSLNYDVYVRGSHDVEATRVGEGQAQQFSPDGTAVLAVIYGPPSRVMIYPIGPGDSKTVATGSILVTQARWLPDGRRLLVIGTEPSQGQRAYVTDVAGSAPRAITPERITYTLNQVAVSHDGSRVAFRSPEGTVVLYSTATAPATVVKGLAVDEMPIGWSGDDRSLLLLDQNSPRRLVAVDPSSGQRKILKEIAPSNPSLIGPREISLTPDGRSFVGNYQSLQMTLFLVEGLK